MFGIFEYDAFECAGFGLDLLIWLYRFSFQFNLFDQTFFHLCYSHPTMSTLMWNIAKK